MRWTQKHVYFKLTCVALISYILHYTTKQKNALLITEKVFCLKVLQLPYLNLRSWVDWESPFDSFVAHDCTIAFNKSAQMLKLKGSGRSPIF